MTLTIETAGFDVTSEWRGLFEEAAAAALEHEGLSRAFEISLYITDDEEIRRLNKFFRKTARATDVLSFPGSEDFRKGDKNQAGEIFLGDIVISAERAAYQAESFGHSLTREMVFLFVHSMLHLLGYDHEDPSERDAMEEKQRQIMEKLGIPRDFKEDKK